MGCLSRIGCLTLGMFVGVVALAGLLATRHVGPRAVEGGFRYQAGGRERTVLLSDAAARSFDAKVNGQLPSAAVLEAVTAGVPITEEELNSRIAEEVARRPLGEYGATVDRVFVRLTPSGAIAYVYSTVRGVAVALHSDLVFDLERGALRVELRDPHVGRLPVGVALPHLLDALHDQRGLEETIAFVIPPQVRAIRYEEGRMRVLINPLASRARPGRPPPAGRVPG